MKFREIYCSNCKTILGRYNTKFFSDDKIGELLKVNHSTHVKSGHQIVLRTIKKYE